MGRNSLLFINSIFIVTEIEKRPSKLLHSVKNIFLTALSKLFCQVQHRDFHYFLCQISSGSRNSRLLGFFPWYLLLSAGFHPCLTAWKRRVQHGVCGRVGWRLCAGWGQPANRSFPSESPAVDGQWRWDAEKPLWWWTHYVPAPSQLQLRDHWGNGGVCGTSRRALGISPPSARQTPSDLRMRSNDKAGFAMSHSSGPVTSRGPVQPLVLCDHRTIESITLERALRSSSPTVPPSLLILSATC